MLKKLYKHEFHSLFRSLLPIWAALIGFAVLSRLTFLTDLENDVLNIARGLSVTAYVLGIFAVFIVGLVIVVMRFYKNLLTHEGYLTFTLPFTPTQHIFCKLICGVVVIIIDFVVVICSLLVLGAGTEILGEILSDIRIALTALPEYFSAGQIALISSEVLLLLLLSPFQSLLMFYAAMALGQQFKNKVGGAAIAYICLYAAVQIITSLIMIPISFVTAGGMEEFDNLINDSVMYLGLFFGFLIVMSAVLSIVYFVITRHFLTKKLNLE
ncbi:MAG: hypothetical protein U0L66_08885 [Acutalibacteraceae bacterium]|nr:hypothetical protein [Acutalibacteraceae bacterium]